MGLPSGAGYAPASVMLPLHQWLVLSAQGSAGDAFAEVQPPAPLPIDWLFSASLEPVLIVNAASALIAQLNPAAANLFGKLGNELSGTPFIGAFDSSSLAEIKRCLAMARKSGSADSAAVRTRDDGPVVRVQVSLARAAADIFYLVRLDGVPTAPSRTTSAVLDAVEGASVGFLMAESGLLVEYANRAFFDMVQVESASELYGTSVLHWLKFAQADLTRLREQMSEHQAVTLLTTQLSPLRTPQCRVEVCAIPVPEEREHSWGFTVRELPNLN